ncbi:hypothetical protein Q7P37_009874 [Cladosporium fusiforme]
MGVRCDLPAARRPREKELTRRSGKAPREKTITALRQEVSNLKEQLCETRKTLEATLLENARLTAGAQEHREHLQQALVFTSGATGFSRHYAPVTQGSWSDSSSLKWWIYGIVVVILWALIFTFVFIFLCDPVKQQWSLERIGKCMDQIFVLKSLVMTNVMTDLCVFILPIRAVWKLQMRKTEKLAVISCFALGLACVIIGIVRFWQIYVIDLIGNLTGTSLTTFMLCSIELMLAGLCINIPMFRPFYIRSRGNHGKASYATSESGVMASSQGGTPGHATWIELENGHDSDGGSERKLTMGKTDVIHVTQSCAITSKN